MSPLVVAVWTANCVLMLAFLVGIVFGIRGIGTGRIAPWLCLAGCTILLCFLIWTFAFEFFALYNHQPLMDLFQWASIVVHPIGVLMLTAAAICGLWSSDRPQHAARSSFSHGKQLLVAAVVTLVIVPVSAGIVLAMFNSRGLFVPTTFVALLAIPSIVVWLLASRYLEAMRFETTPSGQRPVTLWAYSIASLSSLGAIFFALFAFILLGLQQGWINR